MASTSMRPASLSTFRCLEACGCRISSRAAISPTVRGWWISSSTMCRRCGSASALNVVAFRKAPPFLWWFLLPEYSMPYREYSCQGIFLNRLQLPVSTTRVCPQNPHRRHGSAPHRTPNRKGRVTHPFPVHVSRCTGCSVWVWLKIQQNAHENATELVNTNWTPSAQQI